MHFCTPLLALLVTTVLAIPTTTDTPAESVPVPASASVSYTIPSPHTFPRRSALVHKGFCAVDPGICHYKWMGTMQYGKWMYRDKMKKCEKGGNECPHNGAPCFVHLHKAYCNGPKHKVSPCEVTAVAHKGLRRQNEELLESLAEVDVDGSDMVPEDGEEFESAPGARE